MEDGGSLIRFGLGLLVIVPLGIGLGYLEQRREKRRWGEIPRGPDEEYGRDPYNKRSSPSKNNTTHIGPYR